MWSGAASGALGGPSGDRGTTIGARLAASLDAQPAVSPAAVAVAGRTAPAKSSKVKQPAGGKDALGDLWEAVKKGDPVKKEKEGSPGSGGRGGGGIKGTAPADDGKCGNEG